MKNNRLIALIVLLVGAAGLVFAGGAKEGATGQRLTINVASTFPPNSPQDQGVMKFKELAGARSNGRLNVLIHPANAMGDERQTFEMLSAGSVEYGVVGTNDIATFFPRFAVAEVPYMFSSADQFWRYWAGPGKELSEMIERERGVRTAGVILRGARYLTANRPINSVADLKGLKLRLPPVKSWTRVWESLGALPVTVAFGEVYMALKTGTVEAQENPPETILNFKFYEAQKYLIQTEHIYSAARVQLSMKWWNGLAKADQDILAKAMDEGVAFANNITKTGDADFVKKLQDLGMTLIKVDKAEFQRAVAPAVDEFAKAEWDPAFFARVKALR